MNKEDFYKKFRYELEDYAVPLIVDNLSFIELHYEKNIVGFACIYNDYLDAFYILPEYRRKGLGSQLVKDIYKIHKFKTLHIINNNVPALKFWNKNFKLKKLEINFCDTLYEIIEKEKQDV